MNDRWELRCAHVGVYASVQCYMFDVTKVCINENQHNHFFSCASHLSLSGSFAARSFSLENEVSNCALADAKKSFIRSCFASFPC